MIGPKHVAIIMDGNGRWGLKKNKTRNYGHSRGIKTVEKIIQASLKKRLKFLTLFTFSTENWRRPKGEINFLFKLLENYIDKELKRLIEQNIKIKIIGNLNKMPSNLVQKLKKVEKFTKKNFNLQINVALNYGSRQEIIFALKKLNKKMLQINEKTICCNLYTKNIPDPDILIRTGGYQRLSNFIMFNLTYTELFFTETLWPDFTKKEFNSIVDKFLKINRKYGL